MAQDNCQKIKLLKLMEILRQETDGEHPMRATAVCERLVQEGISCDRRTLSKDLTVLNDYGFEVMSVMVGHEKAYYIEDRSFSVPELKILIDAVQAASFITEKKTQELVAKIAALSGSHQAAVLKRNMVCFNTRKHGNESIYYNVGFLEDAIEQQCKIIFLYFDLDENGEKVFRRGGHHYVVEPIALVFNEDNYYLICYSSRHDSISNYRVDRMTSVELIDNPICQKAIELRNSVADYTEQAFKMYGGPLEDVTLSFPPSLIGVVYDKFGEDTVMRRYHDDVIGAKVKVRISPTFWGWLFQFGGDMKIAAPNSLIEEYRRQAAKFAE